MRKKFNMLLIAMVCTCGAVKAQQSFGDTVAYASLTDKTVAGTYYTQAANVIFPSILAGNEAASADYIANFSTQRRDYLIRTYNRGKRFFGKAAAILKKYRLPQELKVLLALESGFNGNAVSKAGAVGYWQLMDETAKEYGLRIVEQPTKVQKVKAATIKLSADSLAKLKKLHAKDERRNFNRSTHAAARYLRDRSRNLNNNWLLIVASYNCGVGNVWDAMAKSGKDNPTYWDIKDYLPAETRGYVQNFIALNVIYNNYDQFIAQKLTFKPTLVKAGQSMAEALATPTL